MLLPSAFVVLLALGQSVSAAIFNPKGPVVSADVKTFDDEVLSLTKPTFVAFTAPWCGHCRNLAPEYERASRSLEGIIKFVNVDCDDQRNAPVCQKYGVSGFPTIKMFPPTKKRLPKDYRGERTAKALIEYATSELPLSNVKKLAASQIESFVRNVRVCVWHQVQSILTYHAPQDKGKVLLFTSKPSSTPLYKSLALDLKDILTFATARSDNEEVRQTAQDTFQLDLEDSGPKLLYIPPKDPSGFKVYDGPPKFKSLFAWLQGVSPEASAANKPKTKSKAKAKTKANGQNKKAAKEDL